MTGLLIGIVLLSIPLSMFLGGKRREKIRTWVSDGYKLRMLEEEVGRGAARRAALLRDQGQSWEDIAKTVDG